MAALVWNHKQKQLHPIAMRLGHLYNLRKHPLIEWEDATMRRIKDGRVSISGIGMPGQGMIFDHSDTSNPRWQRMLFYKPQASKAMKLLSDIFFYARQNQ